MRSALVAAVLLALALTGCTGGSDPAPTATPPPEPSATPSPTATPQPAVFEPAECRFEVPASFTAACGYLIVPEDRSEPSERTIRLHVGMFRSPNAGKAPDPVVFLSGGPGQSALDFVRLSDIWFAPLLEDRDLIVVDQRGTGYSEPRLDCPEIIEAQHALAQERPSLENQRARELQAVTACHDRLLAQAVNLGAYNTPENAADFDDLRKALGYDQWNLYGGSYGTRLAQTIMRDHPGGLRSVVLDSTYQLEIDLYAAVPANLARAFQVFFDGCRADPSCQAAYPNLEATFYDLVDRLNAQPAVISVTNALTNETLSGIQFTGDMLVGYLFETLYSRELVELAPQIIALISEGNYAFLERVLGALQTSEQLGSPGMNLSVQCAEEAAYRGDTAPTFVGDSRLLGYLDRALWQGEGLVAACEVWDVDPAGQVENEAVRSDIPTLVLAGEYDPITPPAGSQTVSQNFSRSFFFEFPGLGHASALSDPCSSGVLLAFLRDPSLPPDASCIAGLGGPDFHTS